jgi:predicted AAA+ superfamily ATPase
MWIERTIASELVEIAQSFPVLALVGPRQVGKTSILEKTFPDYRYVSLDVGINAEAAETRPSDFIKRNPPPVVLDEIQYAPSFFRYIKTYVDAHKGKNGLFILSGSQNFLLMEKVSESLAGRAAIIPMLGLSAEEWKNAGAISGKCLWPEFLWKGSFPGLWEKGESSPSRDRWYQGYVATYLERDVRNLMNVGNLRDFERFLRATAVRCSQMLNLSELGRDVGVSSTTAKQWMSVLEASNQVFLLEPFYRSLGKRIVKSPKLYFTDTGLAAYLMGFGSVEALWSSDRAGSLWENHVIGQWVRHRNWRNPSLALWYWRNQSGIEVDLILEKDQKLIAVECKLKERPVQKDMRGIKSFRKFYGEKNLEKTFIACPIDMPFDFDHDVTVMPGWMQWEI